MTLPTRMVMGAYFALGTLIPLPAQRADAGLDVGCPAGLDSVVARPTSPNYCTGLAPTPDLDSVSGIVELGRVDSPFGIAVTRDGHPRYALAMTINGLPHPATLGPYTVYLAWAFTLTMDGAVKLGVVHNGRTTLGELDREQFRILVTAERSAAAPVRRGRIVLRGTSPSTRLLAHRDLTTPVAPGAVRGTAMTGMALTPSMARSLPGAAVETAALPEVRSSETAVLRSGDTLTLTATLVRRTIAGRRVVLYGFNGQVPGPLIRVEQNASIVVRFRNDIDRPTAVHWHGVRVENRFDGAIGVTQDAVPPGGSFSYTVRFPDAGIFWYHAHEREDMQQMAGLYGVICVTGRSTALDSPVNQEEMITLGDMLFEHNDPVPFGVTAPTHALMGRFGNVFLVNGEPRYTRRVARGAVVRFFFTNVSNARIYNLSFAAARMKLIASDQGKFARESWVESVVIAPAERYVVDVRFTNLGAAALTNRVQALDHPSGTIYPEIDTVAIIDVRPGPAKPDHEQAFDQLRSNRDVAADIERFRTDIDRPPDHALALEMRPSRLPAAIANMLTGASQPVDWNDGMGAMNAASTGNEVTWVLHDPASGKDNMAIDWHFPVGTVAKLRIFNDPVGLHPMDHPIHVHGERMLVVSRNGTPETNWVWKDTVLIPAGEIVDVLIEMSNPGRWMLHCHIAEHRGSQMMMAFVVDSI